MLMKKMTLKTITTVDLPFGARINPPTAQSVFVLILFLLVCFAFLPRAQAVLPPPDGGYPGANTAEGTNALFSLTTGSSNTAIGNGALFTNSTGSSNTATGDRALANNRSAHNNTATGFFALFSNTSGDSNTATGFQTLLRNVGGVANTATGSQALLSNWTGSSNTATGSDALRSNTSGYGNTATGSQALFITMTGRYNTASGVQALFSNTTGRYNTAIGVSALQNSTGGGNIALGFEAGFNVTTASNVICIGTEGRNVSNSCYIGKIFGQISSRGSAVFINSDGKLGTATSSRRFKEQIKPMERTSEVLFALKPVTFHYKQGLDPEGIAQFGLVAEEVAKVNRDLIVRDKEGEPFSVRYEAVNAMLLNEFLKEHKRVQELKATVAKQEANAARQQKQIDGLTAGLQKVSAKLAAAGPSRGGLEASEPAPRVVLNKP